MIFVFFSGLSWDASVSTFSHSTEWCELQMSVSPLQLVSRSLELQRGKESVPPPPQPRSLTLINWGLSSNWPALTNTIHQLLITERLEKCSGGNCVKMERLYLQQMEKESAIAMAVIVIWTGFTAHMLFQHVLLFVQLLYTQQCFSLALCTQVVDQ